jgi:hypothetical protein
MPAALTRFQTYRANIPPEKRRENNLRRCQRRRMAAALGARSTKALAELKRLEPPPS